MLLIKESEYDNFKKELSAITSNNEVIVINSQNWIYCEVTNQVKFDILSVSLDSNNFTDSIILPNNINK